MFSDYNMVAFLFAPIRKDNMNNQPAATPSMDSDQDAEAVALRAEADRSIAQAYQAAADFMKDLAREN